MMFVSDGLNTSFGSADVYLRNQPSGTMRDRMWQTILYDQMREKREAEEQAADQQAEFVSQVVVELNNALQLGDRIKAMETNLETTLDTVSRTVRAQNTRLSTIEDFMIDLNTTISDLTDTVPSDAVSDPNPPARRYWKRPI